MADTASSRAAVSLRSTFPARPLAWAEPIPAHPRRHRARSSLRLPSTCAAAPGVFAPAPGQAALLPSRRLRAGRLAARPAANGRAENRDTCRSDRCPESPEDGPRFDHRRQQPTASTSSQAPRLMQPVALGGHHATHARRHGRVRHLASPSACTGLLRRHRSGYRLARLRTSRDFARADQLPISFCYTRVACKQCDQRKSGNYLPGLTRCKSRVRRRRR